MRNGHGSGTIIVLPADMPLQERISAAADHLRDWMEGLETPICWETDRLVLAEYDRKSEGHVYFYAVITLGRWKDPERGGLSLLRAIPENRFPI